MHLYNQSKIFFILANSFFHLFLFKSSALTPTEPSLQSLIQEVKILQNTFLSIVSCLQHARTKKIFVAVSSKKKKNHDFYYCLFLILENWNKTTVLSNSKFLHGSIKLKEIANLVQSHLEKFYQNIT